MDNYNASAILYSRNSYDFLLNIKDICNKNTINLFYERDFFNLATKTIQTLPNFIIIDNSSVKVEKFPFEILNNQFFEKTTKIVILSDKFECKNKFIDVVPYNKLQSYLMQNNHNFKTVKQIASEDFSNKINNLLLKLGISPNLKGRDYLKFCINLIVNDGMNFRGLYKDCYPVLAINYKTKVINIERDIRNAIKTAYLTNNYKNWEQYFNCFLEKVPSNKKFICLCVDKIKQEI